jgi:hypothetical protein
MPVIPSSALIPCKETGPGDLDVGGVSLERLRVLQRGTTITRTSQSAPKAGGQASGHPYESKNPGGIYSLPGRQNQSRSVAEQNQPCEMGDRRGSDKTESSILQYWL